MSTREVVEGVQNQGADEAIAYSMDTGPVGGSPSVVSVVVYDEGTWAAVTDTVMPDGEPDVDEDVITLPLLTALTAGHTYRVEVQFTTGGNVLEHYIRVHCER